MLEVLFRGGMALVRSKTGRVYFSFHLDRELKVIGFPIRVLIREEEGLFRSILLVLEVSG